MEYLCSQASMLSPSFQGRGIVVIFRHRRPLEGGEKRAFGLKLSEVGVSQLILTSFSRATERFHCAACSQKPNSIKRPSFVFLVLPVF